MRARFWLPALGLMGLSLYAWWQAPPPYATAQEQLPAPRRSAVSPQYLGAGSCAAAACHNSTPAHPSSKSEFTTWASRDPHAHAYEVLFTDRSIQIQKLLSQKTAAHEDQRCLSCHVAPAFDVKKSERYVSYFKTDGVSCESCHGPAEHWLHRHHLESWQHESPTEKKRLGMTDTRSLVGRAKLCARCHVGEAGMDVDHDLIAAGHPRLHFELAAFHAHMPRHWPDAKDRAGKPDFEARLWAIGQLVTSQAALELLAYRAEEKNQRAWPEFAEFDCAACHHDLRAAPQFSSSGPRKVTTMPWGPYVDLTPEILETLGDRDNAARTKVAFAQIREAMTKAIKPNRDKVANHSKSAAQLLGPPIDRLSYKFLDSLDVTRSLDDMLGKQFLGNSDQSSQVNLGVAALYHAYRATGGTFTPRSGLLKRELDSPKSYDPEAIRKRLRELMNLDIKKDS